MWPVSVQYTVFGEMAVLVGGTRHPLARRRERGVLSVLLAAHGAPVAAERLVAEVWGDDGRTNLASLQVAVSRLRNLLEPGRAARSGSHLVSTSAGYSLRAEVDDVDAWVFEARAEEALAAQDAADALRLCDQARAPWTAAPYVDADAPLVRAEAGRLEELHVAVNERRARALLDLDRPDEVQRAMADLASQHPYRERVWMLLALAQYRSARQADALDTLRTLRQRLADDLGVDPSDEVRELEQAVLRQEPELTTVRRSGVVPPSRAALTSGRGTVGRTAPQAAALSFLDAAVDSASARFVLVAGEPGIGKSRLVGDLAATARDRGTTVLVGRCQEGDYAPALWPWLGVVRRLVEAEGGAPDPLLAPLLDHVTDAQLTDTGAGTGLRMFDALVDLLARAATRAPVLLVLEDIHWADATSLRLLQHLAAAEVAAPIAVVCTRRTTETGTPDVLVDAMAALARAGAERIRLDGLDTPSVGRLLAASIGAHDERLDEVVADVTGGNPFFVLQYARLLAGVPELDPLDPATLPVPDGVRDVLRQRVGRLPEAAHGLLAAGAVLGSRIDPDVVAELAGMDVEEALDLLDLALASGLVEEQASGYAFVHALARDTLYADLSVARRMRLHDRAGRILERTRPDDPDASAAIAHHAHVAAPLGRDHADRAGEWLARAAAVAEGRHAHPEALALWQLALDDAVPGSRAEAWALRGKAGSLIRLGRVDEAHAALDAAVAIACEHEDWTTVAEAAAVLSAAGPWSWREHGVTHAPFLDALTAALPHVAPPLRARLLAILQLEHFYAWRTDLVEDHGRRSVELARDVGDAQLLREVLMLRLVATAGSWDAAGRLALAEELLALEPEGELEVTALFHLGHIRWDSGDPAGADDAVRRCEEAAAGLRHSGIDIPLGWWRATRARDRDDPGHRSLIDAALATHLRDGYLASRELVCLHGVRSGPVGSPVAADTVAEARGGGMPVRALVAHALLEAGRPEEARELLGERVDDDIVDYCSTAGRALRLLVLCATAGADEIREALAPLEGHLGVPVSYGTIDHLGVVDHFVAAGWAALGDPRAVEVARSAVELNARLGCLPWLRRSERLLAELER